jgi:hypothetical protein
LRRPHEDDAARAPLDGNEFQGDIRKLIEKAAFRYPKEKIAIRSSLPGMFDQATESARKAETAAKRMATFNFLGGLGAVIAIGGLLFTASNFLSGLSGRNEEIAGDLRATVELQQSEIKVLSEQVSELRAELERIRSRAPDPSRPAG